MKNIYLIALCVLLFIGCQGDETPDNSNDNPLNSLFASNMVFVEGGTFTMGQSAVAEPAAAGDSTDDDSPRADELPAHEVTLSDFYISKYEVTQAQWIAVMGENPSYFAEGGDYPVENISWGEVQEFLAKLNELTGENYRLPTEAEWEYAARGGKYSESYRYSGSDNVDEVAWYSADNLTQPSQVGQKEPNELGLYDMSGNAFEWVFDWFGAYSAESQTNPKGSATGEHHVLRGGSWKHSSNGCRVSFRSRIETTHLNKCGFRIVKGIDLDNLPYTEVEERQLTDIFIAERGTFNNIELPYRKATIGTVSAENKGALVIYLHGGSAKGNDNTVQLTELGVEKIYKYLVANNINATMLVPQCPSTSSWGKSLNIVLKGLISAHIATVDTSRIYGFGGSMGGTGLWSLISAYSGMFTAAMPVAANPSGATVENILPTYIYTVMGKDDALMKIDIVETFIINLRNAGGIAMFDIEEGWDHATTCEESYTDSRLAWIFSKTKTAQ